MRNCHCKDCSQTFRSLKNLSAHRNKKHKQSVSASIRNGIRNSKKTPRAKSKELSRIIRDIGGVAVGLAPAIISRNPVMAIGAAKAITDLIADANEYLTD